MESFRGSNSIMTIPVLQMVMMASGGGQNSIALVSHDFLGLAISPGTTVGGFSLGADGDLSGIGNFFTPPIHASEWHIGNPLVGLGAGYEVRATLISGSTPTTNAGLGVFLRLNVGRIWSNERTVLGTRTSRLTLEFRVFGQTNIIKTVANMVIEAEVTI